MYPVLGKIRAEAAEAMRPNPAEVKETFLVPADFFRANLPVVYACDVVPLVGEDFPYELIGFPKGYRWRSGTMEVPIYRWEGRAIWGLTGRIVRRLMEEMV